VRALRQSFDHPEEFGAVVTAPATELDEFDRLRQHGATLGRSADVDAKPAPELEESLVAE
jgi:hypothetical protein